MRSLMTRARAALAAFTLLFAAAPALADGPGDAGPDVAAPPVRAAPLPPPAAQPAAQLEITGQSGQIALAGGDIDLNVPRSYRFYNAEVALSYLQRNGAASPNGTVLGLLAPASARIDQPGVWATVLSYDEIGYVASDSAASLGDAALEQQVRDARTAQGRAFEGFAAQPAFNSAAAGLTWAERAAAPGTAGAADFRHEQRVLGREGVAGLTSVGTADQMGAITAALPDLVSMLRFPAGKMYADHQANDAVSEYTVPMLVTGIGPETAEAQTAAAEGAGANTQGGGLAGMFPWIALGAVVLAGAGYLMMRRPRDPNMDPDEA